MKKDIIGLSSEEVLRSREKNGDNSLVKEKSKGIIKRFFENLNDPVIKVLIFALVIEVIFTLGHTNYFEVFGILSAILIAATVSTVSEFGSERAFLKMQAESEDGRACVIREGVRCEVGISEIVVGDILCLSAGEKVHADGFVISGSIKVDQSALNGESREVTKAAVKNGAKLELSDGCAVFRGSLITGGEALMRVSRVGIKTYYGIVAKDVQAETRESPLKHRLSKFASQISKLGYVMAVIVALTYLFNTFVADNGFIMSKILASLKDTRFLFSTLIHALTLMITVVVVAAPEGLPMMITVVLSANMKKMMRDGVLVRKLVGIETAGSLNILFTDKTGTLTQGKMDCDGIVTYDASHKGIVGLKRNAKVYRLLCLSALYNTDSTLSGGGVVGGNATDRAILEFFKNEPTERYSVAEKVQFTSDKKYSEVTLDTGDILIKGAPEVILKRTESALLSDGTVVPMDKEKVLREYREASSVGKRVIAVAYRPVGSADFVFIALMILKDKIRKGVKEAVMGVRRAGVQVVMLTGDGKETATAIARECGIMQGKSGEIVLTSDELSKLSDDELKALLPNLCVLARALPQDKTRLVRVSAECDLVVGMTGDGINDAPSLKLADIGFAMGNGEDIAKSAADIVLVDNSFFSINRTILYGRTIFKSIRKFITFQLVMNLTACGVSLVGQFLGIDSPITIIQMLWVNIIMDTLGGLAFSGEAALEYYMKEKPKRRDEGILSSEMMHHIVFTGLYTLCLCVAFLRLDFFRSLFRVSDNDVVFMTAFYALFIFAGIFNCFGARCERMWMFSNLGKNKPFVLIMSFISLIQILMIYYGGTVFRTVPLTLKELLYVILFASSVIPFEFIRRLMYKLKR
jgi:calcium-translocating P-type ATPase